MGPSVHGLFCTATYNARKLVEYPLFARILSALCQASKSTNPTIHRHSLHSAAGLCLVGIIDLLARCSANIQAESATGQKRNLINQHAPMQ
jgi:hypothetical protein